MHSSTDDKMTSGGPEKLDPDQFVDECDNAISPAASLASPPSPPPQPPTSLLVLSSNSKINSAVLLCPDECTVIVASDSDDPGQQANLSNAQVGAVLLGTPDCDCLIGTEGPDIIYGYGQGQSVIPPVWRTNKPKRKYKNGRRAAQSMRAPRKRRFGLMMMMMMMYMLVPSMSESQRNVPSLSSPASLQTTTSSDSEAMTRCLVGAEGMSSTAGQGKTSSMEERAPIFCWGSEERMCCMGKLETTICKVRACA